jgi:small subunit ribosomal protein S16
MSVRIRLRRIGRKKQPSYRVVVADSARPRDGAYIEEVGFYNPRRSPAELRLDLGRVDVWVGRGAEMTETVAALVRKARKGGDDRVAVTPLPAAKAAGEAAPAEAADAPAEG